MNNQWNWTKSEQQQGNESRNQASRNNDESSRGSAQQRSQRQENQRSGSQQQGQHERQERISALSPAAFFTPFSGMYQNMDRMFDTVMRNFSSMPSMLNSNPLQSILPSAMQQVQEAVSGMSDMATSSFNPSVDISSTEREYTIEMETPGINENDIRINLMRDGTLCICGEKRLENEKLEKDFHRIERSYGSFSRTLSLPDDADLDAIEARFENGVLMITVSKLESYGAQARRIEIASGEENERGRGGRQQSGEKRQDRHQAEGKQESGASASSGSNAQPKRVA
jgi:HSP20 family protein